MFDWNDLRHFLAVARTGSTNAAAKALRVNQSTVQRRLAALEEGIGRKLFERYPGGYRLTSLGEDIRRHAEAVEAAVAALERRLAATDSSLTGTIRVTCAEGIASFLMTPLLDPSSTPFSFFVTRRSRNSLI
ncbi:MAG TPA: LysR family transcriptional regulator [Bradyrhizobium sp.]|nr:LysR family transcriptional regulator [Bradyrhizobium sp.]